MSKCSWKNLSLVLIPVLADTAVVSQRPLNRVTLATLLVFSLIWTGVLTRRLLRRAQDRANYRLGFAGERYVGEELNRLVPNGFEMHHDLRFDGFRFT